VSAPVTIVLPTFDEAENLPVIVPAILATGPDVSVLVVDDASPDGTGALADRLSAELPGRVAVLHRARKAGLGPALVAGFSRALEAGAAVVGQMDADRSHDPAMLPTLRAALDAGADVAVGSRWVEGGRTRSWGVGRRLLSRGGSLYARLVLGLRGRDLTAGYKLWRRAALLAVDPAKVTTTGYAFQVELAFRAERAGLRIAELPIEFHDRRVGRSKLSSGVVREAVVRLPMLRLRGGR